MKGRESLKRGKATKNQRFRQRHPHLFFLVGGVAIIMFWRGVWGLLDTYLLPQYEILSLLVSIALGVIILYLDDFSLDELRH